MKKSTKVLPKSQQEIRIELEAEDIAKYRPKAIAEIGKHAKISGFRAGHIPEKIILERYGEEAVRAEMLEIAIPSIISKIIVEEKLFPIVRPETRIEGLDPIVFVATITLLPEITLDPKYSAVTVPAKKISVSKKEIDEVIHNLFERNMERSPIDRPAKKGDFVEIDFSGKTPDGVPLDGTVSKMHPLVLGSGNLVPGFEDALIGLSANEEKEFEITFPKDYGAKHLAGKPVIFSVKMRGVFSQTKPKITEEFTEKILGEKLSEADFRTKIEDMLREKAEEEEHTRRENELLEKWTDLAKADLPDFLVNEELENMIRMLKTQILYSGLSWEQHLENLKKTEEEFRQDLRKDAERRSLNRLVIGKILSEKKIEVSEEEIHSAMHRHDEVCDHAHDTNSEDWKSAAHRVRVNKLFDSFLK